MTNTYVLGNARWTKILARNRNVAPGNANNFNGRGVPSFIGAGDGAVPLGTKNRIHIVNGAEAFTLQKEMGATVQVMNARPPIASGKYIVKTSWYRGAKGVDFEKWARQCRKEAYIQSELSTQYARCGIFPRVMFHGFVRGAFHVVSECPPNIRLVDIERISTVSEARATYNAVAAAIYLMWTSKVAPMRYAPHMFALAGARSPHAVVLDYNKIVIFDEVVDKAFRPYLQRLKAVEGSCGRLKTKPGTLESIWFGLGSVTRRMMAKHMMLYKSYKEPGERTKYTSVMNFLARLGETMNDPPAAGRRAVSRGGRGRQALFGRGLRGILGGRRSRSDPDKKSPPLKIRKVATLPESEGGWRPRKHSATWGVTRTAESNHNSQNNARHGNRTSQFRAPNAIYTSPKSTPSNNGNENGIASAPPAQSTPMFPASSAPPNPFVNNNKEANSATEAFNANYNLFTVGNKWNTWNQSRKNHVLKKETKVLEKYIELLKNTPEIQAVLALKVKNNNGNANTQARSRSEAFDGMMKNIMTNALKTGKYKNKTSGLQHVDKMISTDFLQNWKLVDPSIQVSIITQYLEQFKTKITYSELLKSRELNELAARIHVDIVDLPESFTNNTEQQKAWMEMLDNRIQMYIATYLHTMSYIATKIDHLTFDEYIKDSLMRDVEAVRKSVKTFAHKNNDRAMNYSLINTPRQNKYIFQRYLRNPRFNVKRSTSS
jgi:hypothetical protein